MFFKSLSKYASQRAFLSNLPNKTKSLPNKSSQNSPFPLLHNSPPLKLSIPAIYQTLQNSSHQDQQNNSHSSSHIFLSVLGALTTGLSVVLCNTEQNPSDDNLSWIQYPSNRPIEDRWSTYHLHALPGHITAVFDGHGGWQLAEYASKNLAKEIDNCLQANSSKSFASADEYIITSIREGFDKVENNFLEVAREVYKLGFGKAGAVGSCALLTLTYNGKIYVANLGDCQGVICENNNGKISARKINKKLNANSKKEQERLRNLFKEEEKDIVVCREGEEKACYVKNRLQPTRAFGDFDMKHEEFNNPKDLGKEFKFYKRFEVFAGNYVTHQPEISVLDIKKNDQYLILSTDGMWDELSRDEVVKVVENKKSNRKEITEELLNMALRKAAEKKNMQEDVMRAVKVGKRRDLHDDMTIIVVDLNQEKK